MKVEPRSCDEECLRITPVWLHGPAHEPRMSQPASSRPRKGGSSEDPWQGDIPTSTVLFLLYSLLSIQTYLILWVQGSLPQAIVSSPVVSGGQAQEWMTRGVLLCSFCRVTLGVHIEPWSLLSQEMFSRGCFQWRSLTSVECLWMPFYPFVIILIT